MRHLHYFLAVAKELHFGRATQRLFIAHAVAALTVKLAPADIAALETPCQTHPVGGF